MTSLMKWPDDELNRVQRDPIWVETGMNFHVARTDQGIIAVMADGYALPCYQDITFFDLNDLLAGLPLPSASMHGFSQPSFTYPNRLAALKAISIPIPVAYPLLHPAVGAVPLLVRRKLNVETIFYRYLSSSKDSRYIAGTLLSGTYLTTLSETRVANSGFAAVGRFALPLPMSACNVFQYSLAAKSIIDVGTVAPLFGQSGGGVEVCVVKPAKASLVGQFVLLDY